MSRLQGGNAVSNSSSHFEHLKERIDEFAAEFVDNPQYPVKIPRKGKIIHDPLWGTISLKKWEIALLDQPLFQRLRQIRQTSLVDYVFPGCRHTRFDHTLGVLHQAQKLADAVNGGVLQENAPFGPETILDLRLSALFHDTGHGCFSHLSESIYSRYDEMLWIQDNLDEYRGGHPHEILSYLILTSKPVRAYLQKLGEQCDIVFRPERAANWIIGKPEGNNEELRYVAQVINGPFDADKLDYVFRDSHFSGLPLGVDLARLWVTTEKKYLEPRKSNILTLDINSANPLEQILFSKINLFSIVYQHPKVRSAECMLEGVIEYVMKNEGQIAGRDLRSCADYLWLTDDIVFSEATKLPKDDFLHRMIHDILYRRLFVRALTINKDTIDSSPSSYERLRRLNQFDAYEERREVAREIGSAAGLDEECRLYQVWLDLPKDPPSGGYEDTFVRTPGGELKELERNFSMRFWT